MVVLALSEASWVAPRMATTMVTAITKPESRPAAWSGGADAAVWVGSFSGCAAGGSAARAGAVAVLAGCRTGVAEAGRRRTGPNLARCSSKRGWLRAARAHPAARGGQRPDLRAAGRAGWRAGAAAAALSDGAREGDLVGIALPAGTEGFVVALHAGVGRR